MYLVMIIILLTLNPAMGDKEIVPCPQIDKTITDIDGMYFCPPVVSESSAFGVTRCALNQARTWHAPTVDEKGAMARILSAYKETFFDGISKENTAELMQAAAVLGLQPCRVREPSSSYLLLYTIPKKNDYSGPFLMLRESNASKVIMMSPHDGSDGTHTDTKLAFQGSRMLILLSNGCPRDITPDADFIDHVDTLGAVATRQINSLFPKSVWLMIHGMSNDKSVLYRSRSAALGRAFEEGVRAATYIEKFGAFNADYVTDKLVTSGMYLKTEIPSRIHINQPKALAKIVRVIESKPWAQFSEELEDDTACSDICELP